MRAHGPLTAGLALSTAAWLAVLALPLSETLRVPLLDLIWIAIALLVAAAAAWAAFAPGNRANRASFLLLAGGALAWGAGDALWAYYELLRGVEPIMSLADAAYLTTFPLFAAAILVWPRRRRGPALLVDAALLTGVVFLCSFVFLLRPLLEEPLTADLVVAAAYPVGDVALLAALLLGIAAGGLRDGGRLLVLVPGFLALIAADTYYAYAGDAYAVGASWLDAGWTAGLVAVGACALLPPGWAGRLRVPPAAAPLAATGLLAAAGAQIVLEERAQGTIHMLPTALLLGLFVLLTVRHVVVSAALRRKSGRLEAVSATLAREHGVRHTALEGSRTGLCMLAADGTVAFSNSSWNRLLGPLGEQDGGLGTLLAGLAGGAGTPLDGSELSFWTDDGRYLAVASTPVSAGETLLTVDDLTDREQERATRNRFLAEVVRAQDHEARRVAELLHDDVVQRLTALGLRLELTAGRSGSESLLALARDAGEITGSIRRLLVELHPAVLESQGLSAAVDAAAASLRASDVEVVVQELDVRLPPEIEQLAYRLVQEALSNVLRHAGAGRVEVRLAAAAGTLTLEVVDDGLGFEPAEGATAVRRGSLGLQLAVERVALARGRVEVQSAPSRGTSFRAELPYAPLQETLPPAERVEAVA